MAGLIPEDPGIPLPFGIQHPEPLREPGKALRGNPSKKGRSWMAELLFEQTVVAGRAPQFGSLDVGSGGGATGPTRSQLLDGYVGGEPPRDWTGYRELQAELFDAKRSLLVRLLSAEPVFAGAVREWTPKSTTANANISRLLVPYVVTAMEKVYEFGAPPIIFSPAAGFLGTYDMRHHKITLTPLLFARPLKEFVDTLVHEEIHALQAEMMLMLNAQKKGRALIPAERAIAQYWKNEEPKYRSALAAGSQMSPQTRRRYMMIGQEFHAWTTGHYVASKVLGS